eukprot:gene2908-3720_t
MSEDNTPLSLSFASQQAYQGTPENTCVRGAYIPKNNLLADMLLEHSSYIIQLFAIAPFTSQRAASLRWQFTDIEVFSTSDLCGFEIGITQLDSTAYLGTPSTADYLGQRLVGLDPLEDSFALSQTSGGEIRTRNIQPPGRTLNMRFHDPDGFSFSRCDELHAVEVPSNAIISPSLRIEEEDTSPDLSLLEFMPSEVGGTATAAMEALEVEENEGEFVDSAGLLSSGPVVEGYEIHSGEGAASMTRAMLEELWNHKEGNAWRSSQTPHGSKRYKDPGGRQRSRANTQEGGLESHWAGIVAGGLNVHIDTFARVELKLDASLKAAASVQNLRLQTPSPVLICNFDSENESAASPRIAISNPRMQPVGRRHDLPAMPGIDYDIDRKRREPHQTIAHKRSWRSSVLHCRLQPEDKAGIMQEARHAWRLLDALGLPQRVLLDALPFREANLHGRKIPVAIIKEEPQQKSDKARSVEDVDAEGAGQKPRPFCNVLGTTLVLAFLIQHRLVSVFPLCFGTTLVQSKQS